MTHFESNFNNGPHGPHFRSTSLGQQKDRKEQR
jgi:hypothetical protein